MAKVRKNILKAPNPKPIPERDQAIPSLEWQLEEIMENFDFEQVLDYMEWHKSRRAYDNNGKCVGTYPWTLMVKGEFKVPSLEELKFLARRQLEDVIKRAKKYQGDYYYVHSGPFKSTYRYGILVLECVIEYWSGD